jgi:hypothetical protein
MQFYIVVENGEAYPDAYTTYAAAVAAVKEKHREHIEDHIKQCRLEDIEAILADINVPEGANKTDLYIEKGINIIIHKFLV